MNNKNTYKEIKCPKCKSVLQEGDDFCPYCGEMLKKEKEQESYSQEDDEIIRCPNCGSSRIRYVTKQRNSDISLSKGCCGYILFGPLGFLCSFFGENEQITVRKCEDCGKEF